MRCRLACGCHADTVQGASGIAISPAFERLLEQPDGFCIVALPVSTALSAGIGVAVDRVTFQSPFSPYHKDS